MKAAAWMIGALLLGLVLGSWSLKADLRKAQKELADLREQMRQQQQRQGKLDGITSMLKIPHAAEAQPARAPAPASAAAATNAVPGTSAPLPRVEATNAPASDGGRGMRENIQAATDLWKVRSDLARNSFVSTVASNAAAAAQFDVIMAAMNVRLSNSVRTWVEVLKEKQEMTGEDGIRMMNELSGNLTLAYDDLDRSMPPDWRTKAGNTFDVLSFVNPDVALPLTEVEGVVRERQRGDRGGPFGLRPPRRRGGE